MTTQTATSVSWSSDARLKLPRDEVWELLWRPECQSLWLGSGSAVPLVRGRRCILVDDVGPWRSACVDDVEAPHLVRLLAEPAPRWDDEHTSTITLTVDGFDRESLVRIEEDGVDPAHVEEVRRYWEGRLSALEEVAARVANRRRSGPRQAVVLIHGIGEQRPGHMLEALVSSGTLTDADAIAPRAGGTARGHGADEDQPMWVKPDRRSRLFELRRLVVRGTRAQPGTDVYELYWAHVIRDTTIEQVTSWLRGLLLRRGVPATLRPLWRAVWIVLALLTAGAVASLFDPDLFGWYAGVAGVIAALRIAWGLGGRAITTHVLGDASRYLVPRPANIAHRQTIREAGVDLLTRLHTDGRYDRITIVGHSLGSVIAYDVITHAWTRMHSRHARPRGVTFRDVTELERNIDITDADEAHKLQYKAWRCQRWNTQPWLVTDLLTVGSPLTYADFLMADNPNAFRSAKADRTLPTCPPVTETEPRSGHRRVTYDLPYEDPVDGTTRTFKVFHHGAPFAVTRWTNLYFPSHRLGLSGDPIGGPVAPMFGPWVKDVALTSPHRGFTHTRYWTPGEMIAGSHLRDLREAMALSCRRELMAVLRSLPAHVILAGEPR